MQDVRLIERWLPIAELGIESVRERTPMTPFPAPNRLHVWWARRPLVASRAAVLASLLPAEADRKKFLHVLGIHGDPVAARERIANATRRGVRLGKNAYGYSRAFSYTPQGTYRKWLAENTADRTRILDPTAGGGSIPIEAMRLGLDAFSNDLNPVAALVQRATMEWPAKFGNKVRTVFEELGAKLTREARVRLADVFSDEPGGFSVRADGYLWARTITCPYCDGLVPLSPNWRLAPGGIGIRLVPRQGPEGRVCSFRVVHTTPSDGTVRRGTAICPYSDCRRVIDGAEVKRQAQAGAMGEQLYAVVYKERTTVMTKSGGTREKWVRKYRTPRPEDDTSDKVRKRLEEKLPEWEALDMVPSERFPRDANDDRPIQYGMPRWRDLFSARQLLCHGTSVEVFREMLERDRAAGRLDDVRKAAYGYLALAIDKLLSYNCIMSRWHSSRGVVAQIFDRHDFSFKWSYAEMAPLVTGIGYDWAIRQVGKCIGELVRLVARDTAAEPGTLFHDLDTDRLPTNEVTVTCKPGNGLDHLEDASIDAVVMDPPYYDNVMYAELSDFFYVWLKRTAGYVFPEWFRRRLTDKDNEAVANPARFKGQKGARALAGQDYQERMAAIFAECRRVLKSSGIMTLMFTHKATGAWDALTTGLMEAGFEVRASWPIKTESAGSLHIRNKAAAKSTIFLVCRPRPGASASDAVHYWEDVEPKVAEVVRARVKEFQGAGITGVDLYLASFGPALQEFSRHWPLQRGAPRTITAQHDDPYAVTPEDALNTARREVKRWRLEQLTRLKANADLDPSTTFFVLAWDAFRAPRFPYDEGLRLARAVGVDLDRDVVRRLAGKKGSDLLLWDSEKRAAHGALGSPDGSRGMIDAIHHAAHLARVRSLDAARELLDKKLQDTVAFTAALSAVLEVLPIPGAFTDIVLEGDVAGAGIDFQKLWELSRLKYSDRVPEPKQLTIFWREEEETA